MKTTNLTKHDIIDLFRDYNEVQGIEYGMGGKPGLSAVIVFKQSNFNKEYSERSRSYRVTNLDGKIFFNGMLGSSMFGSCLDGPDQNVRLDYYNWSVEYCYLEGDSE